MLSPISSIWQMRRWRFIRLISLPEITEPLSCSMRLKSMCVSLFFILLMVSLSPYLHNIISPDMILCPLCVAETEKVGRGVLFSC